MKYWSRRSFKRDAQETVEQDQWIGLKIKTNILNDQLYDVLYDGWLEMIKGDEEVKDLAFYPTNLTT